jgi:hypothetical protein
MSYLNSRALAMVANALRDAMNVYEKLAENAELPDRLRRQFSAERHMADTLADLFERHPAINAEAVDQEDFRALIWEQPNITKSAA